MTTETTPAQPAATAASAAAGADANWFAGIEGDDLGWVQNRGLDKLDAKGAATNLLRQARELERLRGVPADRILALPQDATAAGALNPIFERLGKPKAANEYKFPAPKDGGDDKDFVEWAAPVFHEANLTQAQAEVLYTKLRETAMKYETDKAAAQEMANAANIEKLKAEWKDTYEVNLQIARDTVRKLGATPEAIGALESALSNTEVIKLFAKIGAKTGESPFVSGTSLPAGVTTPEAAQQRLNELTRDMDFAKKVHSGDTEANRLIRNLSIVAAGGRPAA